MQLKVTAKHISDTNRATDYAKEKISKLTKYHSKIEKIEVWLIGEKSHRTKETDFECEIKIVIPGKDLEIKDSGQTIFSAIDKVEDRAKRLLVKHKEKHVSREHKQGIVSKIRKRFPF